mmetsp:Transcript_6624/g.27525  ORF Transcript_6624/g.27525 Transcript_6624/m.27525 type:complete len:248 (-) Transcript_6624:515-1258(-)
MTHIIPFSRTTRSCDRSSSAAASPTHPPPAASLVPLGFGLRDCSCASFAAARSPSAVPSGSSSRLALTTASNASATPSRVRTIAASSSPIRGDKPVAGSSCAGSSGSASAVTRRRIKSRLGSPDAEISYREPTQPAARATAAPSLVASSVRSHGSFWGPKPTPSCDCSASASAPSDKTSDKTSDKSPPRSSNTSSKPPEKEKTSEPSVEPGRPGTVPEPSWRRRPADPSGAIEPDATAASHASSAAS